MTFSLVRPAVALLAAALVASPLAAQPSSTDAADSLAPPRLRWTLLAGPGGGVTTLGRPYAAIGAAWRAPGSGFGVRAELAYAGERHETSLPIRGMPDGSFEPCDGCSSATTLDRYGVLGSLEYEFRRGRTLRPYLVSGAALQHRVRRFSFRDPSLPDGPPLGAGCSRRTGGYDCTSRQWGIALHAGGGLALSLGRVDLLGELRVERVDAFGSQWRPTIGVRF